MLIAREDRMPPIGAVGTIVGEYQGDVEVEFDGYPCEAGPGTDWLCDPRWLVIIDDKPLTEEAILKAYRAACRD